MARRLGGEGGRTALVWYALLVLLPALVFGGLLWQQLLRQYHERRAQVPESVADAAGRLTRALHAQFQALLSREDARPFYVYQEVDYFERSTVPGPVGYDLRPVQTPLRATEGIRAWYQYDLKSVGDVPPILIAPQPKGLSGAEAEAHTAWRMQFAEFVEEVLIRAHVETHEHLMAEVEIERLLDAERTRKVMTPIELVALNCALDRRPECTQGDLRALSQELGGKLRNLRVRYGPFEVRAERDHMGELHLIAERFVIIDGLPSHLRAPDCFAMIESEQQLVQGIDIDPDWLLNRLPRTLAADILGSDIALHPIGSSPPEDPEVTAETIDLWDVYGIDLPSSEVRPLGNLTLSAGVAKIDGDFRAQIMWLVGVTAAMVASLLLGIRLLWGSVRASQAQARRTENFVAAVTHELRTPVASVKLHAEMLHEGWVRDEEQRREYLERILREIERLDGLVDRVLVHRMLQGNAPKPRPGDLAGLVAGLREELEEVGGRSVDDLEFLLQADLPPVLLDPEGVREILVNLIENARKYAPVDPGGEPILIRVGTGPHGRVVLEVSDRGPGIPEAERAHVFEPFYRIGDEHTRRNTGTGLGLHLVRLRARAMKARVQLLARPGGGTTFRITFRSVRPGALAKQPPAA